jgi:hypothetical protein
MGDNDKMRYPTTNKIHAGTRGLEVIEEWVDADGAY